MIFSFFAFFDIGVGYIKLPDATIIFGIPSFDPVAHIQGTIRTKINTRSKESAYNLF